VGPVSVQRRQPRSRPETLARRRDILDAATEIFGAKGFTGGTLQEIADQVGMTHAGILHHFGSKDALLLEVLKHRDETDVADLAEQHIPDGTDLFRHLVRTAFANAQRPGIVQAYAVLSAESVTDDHPGREFFQRRYETLRAEVAHAFAVVCAGRCASRRRIRDRRYSEYILGSRNIDQLRYATVQHSVVRSGRRNSSTANGAVLGVVWRHRDH